MDDLVTWLSAQWDEDELLARAASPGPWSVREDSLGERYDGPSWYVLGPAGSIEFPGNDEGRSDAAFVAAFGPGRVLAEVEAKRAILGECVRELADDPAGATARWLACVLALPHRDSPGYRPEWAPETT